MVALTVDGDLFGVLAAIRSEVRPFEHRHGRILQVFAEQASIAIANARLFNDLDAALERQTAMTDVLDAVSQARLDLQPVFDKVAEHADRLCNGTGALVLVREGDELVLSVIAGPMPMPRDRIGEGRVPIDETSITGAAVARRDRPHTRLGRPVCRELRRVAGAAIGSPECTRRPHDAQRRGHRSRRVHAGDAGWLHRRRDRPLGDVRRPGCDRRRQRPPAPRDRGAQSRPVGIIGAPDGDI